MIARAPGPRWRSSRIASPPSSFGITRSMSTTAGRSSSASATASAPSEASPTISIPGCSSRKLRSPSRSTAWSSAMTTRIGSDIEMHGRAFAFGRADLEPAADPLRPLLHRRQPEPACAQLDGLRVEAAAAVDDVEREVAVVAAQPDHDAARLRMSQRVLHRLLRDPEHLGIASRFRRELEIAFHHDVGGLDPPEHVDVLAERAAKAVLHEVGRAELEDQ